MDKYKSKHHKLLKSRNESDDLYLLLEDGNINIFTDIQGEMVISLESFNFNLVDKISYVNSVLGITATLKEQILNYFDIDKFILSIDGYNINGLSETNSDLIDKDSEAYLN